MSQTLELTRDTLPLSRSALPDDYWDGELVSRSDARSGVISANMERVSGTPCFVGTRVPIRNLWDHLEEGLSLDDFLDGFPGVSREQAQSALRLACECLLEGLPPDTCHP